MQKIYVSENISYLCKESKLSQDDFGQLFEVGKGLISNYIRKTAFPKIETLIKICDHYKISLDSLVRENLHEKNVLQKLNRVEESQDNYLISPRYVELLEKQNRIFETALQDKDKIIFNLEEKLGLHEKNRQA